MTYRATGTFEVAMKAQSSPESAPGAALGRMSGTEQLTGIAGSFVIKNVDGKHLYEFEYSLLR